MKHLVNLKEFGKIFATELAKRNAPFAAGKTRVAVGWPIFDEKEIIAVLESMLELRISQGEKVKKFESLYAKEIGAKHAIAVNSGSSANLVALDALIQSGKIKKGSEVIMPATTFTTVASPVLQLGLKPIFVDVEKDSYNIDPLQVEDAISEKTSLIMAVHSLGNPAKMKEIMATAKKSNLLVLEDCCESHGAMIGDKMVGSFGEISTLSFFVAHNITTGEGGMIFCNDSDLEQICRSIREFGRRLDFSTRFPFVNKELGEYDVRYIFERLGYNVRMTDIEASIGIEQLRKLGQFNRQRIENANYYSEQLSKFSAVLQVPKVRKGTVHTYYSYPILVNENAPFKRKELMNYLEKNLIETRAFMGGNLSVQPAYINENIKVHGSLEMSGLITRNMFFLGCHPGIREAEREYVIEKISEFVKNYPSKI